MDEELRKTLNHFAGVIAAQGAAIRALLSTIDSKQQAVRVSLAFINAKEEKTADGLASVVTDDFLAAFADQCDRFSMEVLKSQHPGGVPGLPG